MMKIFLTVSLILLSYLKMAQTGCEEVDRVLHLQIIAKEFTNLPSDPAIQALEEKYFPLTSLALCLFLLQADITDGPETSALYKRVTDIALKYSETDTLILLTGDDNSSKVTGIFNRYAPGYQVRYISIGTKGISVEATYAIGLFNQQMERHLIERNGKEWRKGFHAQLESYYNAQLEKMSKKERKKIQKQNTY